MRLNDDGKKKKSVYVKANTLPDRANNQLPDFGQVWVSVSFCQRRETRCTLSTI